MLPNGQAQNIIFVGQSKAKESCVVCNLFPLDESKLLIGTRIKNSQTLWFCVCVCPQKSGTQEGEGENGECLEKEFS